MKTVNASSSIKLHGDWFFATDPHVIDDWSPLHSPIPTSLIQVPASWEEQGIGDAPTHTPIGAWKRTHAYEGGGWYVRHITIPQEHANHNCTLSIHGVRWFTKVWLDGHYAGEGESLTTSHHFDLTPYVKAGSEQKLVIFVDNRMLLDMIETHIHSYQTSNTWGGITGGVELSFVPATHVRNLKLNTAHHPKSVSLQAEVFSKEATEATIHLEVLDGSISMGTTQQQVFVQEAGGAIPVTMDLGLDDQTQLWSDHNPKLYTARIRIIRDHQVIHEVNQRIGIRSFKPQHRHLLLNGKPVFLRGYADSCIFPLTGYPSWDVEHYRNQFRTVKAYGINHVRLHSWTPPAPFWEAADEEGMIVQTELPYWPRFYGNRYKSVDNKEHQYIIRELKRILEALHFHPSFVMLSLGNELITNDGHPDLNHIVELARALDPHRLYTDNTGFGHLPALDREGDYFLPTLNFHPPYGWDQTATPDTTEDYYAVTRLENKPLIAHEHGHYSMYFNPHEKKKYTGVMNPSFIDVNMDSIRSKGLAHRIDDFIAASGAHLIRSLKENFERLRRTPNLAGVQWLDVRDFPGQGHAVTGILDMFWDSKGLIDPAKFKLFNGDQVLLMRCKSRTFFMDDDIAVDLDLSNYGDADVEGANVDWEVLDDQQRKVSSGIFKCLQAPLGAVSLLGRIHFSYAADRASALQLKVKLKTQTIQLENDWEFWAYPRPRLHPKTSRIWTDIQSLRTTLYGAIYSSDMKWDIGGHDFKPERVDLAIVDQLNTMSIQHLVDGGTVWLQAQSDKQHDEVHTRYLPIHWNYLLFCGISGNSLGMIMDEHPLLRNFPHDRFSNWQWFHLVEATPAICVDALPQLQPIVEVIDTFNRAKRLAYVFEVNVGKGRLFISTFKMSHANDLKRPETNYLFHEFLHYLLSDQFQPKTEMTVGQLVSMFKMKLNW